MPGRPLDVAHLQQRTGSFSRLHIIIVFPINTIYCFSWVRRTFEVLSRRVRFMQFCNGLYVSMKGSVRILKCFFLVSQICNSEGAWRKRPQGEGARRAPAGKGRPAARAAGGGLAGEYPARSLFAWHRICLCLGRKEARRIPPRGMEFAGDADFGVFLPIQWCTVATLQPNCLKIALPTRTGVHICTVTDPSVAILRQVLSWDLRQAAQTWRAEGGSMSEAYGFSQPK